MFLLTHDHRGIILFLPYLSHTLRTRIPSSELLESSMWHPSITVASTVFYSAIYSVYFIKPSHIYHL
jgi:hypothetical protein